MKVVVLGSGPAGLFAVQAACDVFKVWQRVDLELGIISAGGPSPLYGAQYLHQPIPFVTDPHGVKVKYNLEGDVDEYRRKVYGKLFDGKVSPEDLTEEHDAWDIRSTYQELWDKWGKHIKVGEVDPVALKRLLENDNPDLVISTIPRVDICHEEHRFGATKIWAAGDAPEIGIRLPYICPDNTVICNGNDNPSWYRMSRVFGRTTVEWPINIRHVPIPTASEVLKPIGTSCDCWDDAPVHFMGRYGRWEKGVLSHTAYCETRDLVQKKLEETVASAKAGS